MEIENLLISLEKQIPNFTTIKELEKFVGPEDKVTVKILNKLILLNEKPPFLLRIASLIILENVDLKKSLNLISSIFKNCSFQERMRFLSEMTKSKFYVQRMSVPLLIRIFWFEEEEISDLYDKVTNNQPIYKKKPELFFPELKPILYPLLNDEVEFIIKITILSLTENLLCVFSKKEIKDLIEKIKKSSFDLEALIVNLHLLLNEDDFLLESWKVRINYAKLCFYFDNPKIKMLCSDESEEVRLALSFNLKRLKETDDLIEILLKDKNTTVKSNVIEYLCLNDKEIPKEIVSEPWEVKVAFLRNFNSLKNIDLLICIINSLKDNKNWRVRKTVLDSCYKILIKNASLEEKEYFYEIKNTFFSFAFDKVNEIRNDFSKMVLDFQVEDAFLKKVFVNPNFRHRKVFIKYVLKNKIQWAIKELSSDILEIKKELIKESENFELNEENISIIKNINEDELIK